MKKFFLFLLVLGMAPLARAGDDANIIMAHGEGEVRVRPDLLLLEITVRAHGKNAKDAQELNGEGSMDLGKNLREEGVEPKDVQTQNYSVDPVFEYEKDKKVFHGYEAHNYLVVRVHKPETIAKILDRIVDGDDDDDKSVTVRGVRYDTDLRQEYEGQALTKAIANAKAHAEVMAKAAGRAIKDIRQIMDSQVSFNPGPRPSLVRGAMMNQRSSGSGAPELAPGEIVISSSVAVEFSM